MAADAGHALRYVACDEAYKYCVVLSAQHSNFPAHPTQSAFWSTTLLFPQQNMSGDRSGRQKKEIRVFLDSVLLDPVLPQDEIALENALGVLDGHLKNQATDKESLVLDLMSKQNLFEFVFSGK